MNPIGNPATVVLGLIMTKSMSTCVYVNVNVYAPLIHLNRLSVKPLSRVCITYLMKSNFDCSLGATKKME